MTTKKLYRSALNTVRKETGKRKVGKKEKIEAAMRLLAAESAKLKLKMLGEQIGLR